MKPWERALQREPLCAFIEAVVDGFSPIDKHICKFARIAQTMRASAWWGRVPDANQCMGCQAGWPVRVNRYRTGLVHQVVGGYLDEVVGCEADQYHGPRGEVRYYKGRTCHVNELDCVHGELTWS